jgi:riboflavin kinase/FMN adenylyltransferase
MEVKFGLKSLYIKQSTIITVGTFDGVHLGHQRIINQLLEIAAKNNLVPTLVTFEPHPKVVLDSKHDESIQILSELAEKLEIFKELGLERIVVVKFTKKFSMMNYQDFLTEILIKKLKAKFIVVGHDHAFGANRTGTFRELKQQSVPCGYKIKQIDPVEIDGYIISSSVIRNFILEGDIESANKMLGRPYSLRGMVVKGEGRGKFLSFPTANLQISNDKKLIPKEGVYAVDCTIKNKNYRGMVNIGHKPTFGSYEKSIEVHIFDFNQEIYNEKINLHFLKRLRNEKKFSTQQELIDQLVVDKRKSNL